MSLVMLATVFAEMEAELDERRNDVMDLEATILDQRAEIRGLEHDLSDLQYQLDDCEAENDGL